MKLQLLLMILLCMPFVFGFTQLTAQNISVDGDILSYNNTLVNGANDGLSNLSAAFDDDYSTSISDGGASNDTSNVTFRFVTNSTPEAAFLDFDTQKGYNYSGSVRTSNCSARYNFSIPDSCLSSIMIINITQHAEDGGDHAFNRFYCWNSTDWVWMIECHAEPPGDLVFIGEVKYMYVNFSAPAAPNVPSSASFLGAYMRLGVGLIIAYSFFKNKKIRGR